jgi:AcrR family transcriptional regulator
LASKRRKRPEARRGELIAAARKVFARKGVASSAVSDIVKAAGVAQGTFYLYFKTKSDVVNAVVEQMTDEMVDSIERSVTTSDMGAVARLLAFRDAILAVTSDPVGWELAEIYHRPENRVVHDRMAERLVPCLVPLVEGIVRQGVAEGVFAAENPSVSAWFVLGGLHVLETAFTNRAELATTIVDATNCALRALGYSGPESAPSSQVLSGGRPC